MGPDLLLANIIQLGEPDHPLLMCPSGIAEHCGHVHCIHVQSVWAVFLITKAEVFAISYWTYKQCAICCNPWIASHLDRWPVCFLMSDGFPKTSKVSVFPHFSRFLGRPWTEYHISLHSVAHPRGCWLLNIKHAFDGESNMQKVHSLHFILNAHCPIYLLQNYLPKFFLAKGEQFLKNILQIWVTVCIIIISSSMI